MKITVIQPDTAWEDKKANFRKIESLAADLSGKTDMVILPEMFSTGFSMNHRKLSEKPGGLTFKWMSELASNGNFGIAGSYIAGEKNKVFNRWIMVTPDGKSWQYDKRHLFRMGDEDKEFSRGKKRIVFGFRGIKICPNICYDLRFPVWSRNLNDYDLLIYSASWPASRRDVWITLLKARAIENQCFVAGANRTGIDGNGVKHCGDSMIINPKGEVVASADDNECSLSAEISLKELNEFRQSFPVLADADDFKIVS